MLEPGDAGLFDKQLGQLAYVQLGLLAQFGPLSRNHLAQKAIEGESELEYFPPSSGLRMANAALRALSARGFVEERRKVLNITRSGNDALERYPEEFSPLFIQRELLKPAETKAPPVLTGWAGLRRISPRRRR